MTLAGENNVLDDLSSRAAPCHPGVILIEEFLRPRCITQTLLARITGISSRHVSEIIRGIRDITPHMALRLAAGLDTSALDWLLLQARYDLWREQLQWGDMPYKIASDACIRQLHRHPEGQGFACLTAPMPGSAGADLDRVCQSTFEPPVAVLK
jgi:addiction module HigA family antidote